MGPSDFSPDGTILLYQPTMAPADVWMVPVKNPPIAGTPLLNSDANESNATVSPNGRWMAYQSDESGQPEIYVRPFPQVSTGRWQISTGGGTRPRWSRDGRELFYYVVGTELRGAMMAVSIASTPNFTAATPRMLFQGPYPAPNTGRGLYDVSRDGQAFLMIKNMAVEGTSRKIILVQNWFEELKRLVPTN